MSNKVANSSRDAPTAFPPRYLMRDEPRDSYENLERSIDPDRVEEQRDATLEVVDRLRKRGIAVSEVEPPEALTDLLTAVEQFEMAVERHGGDLMVDDLDSS